MSDVVYVVLYDIGDYHPDNVISGVFTSEAEAKQYIADGKKRARDCTIEAWTVGPGSDEIYPLNS